MKNDKKGDNKDIYRGERLFETLMIVIAKLDKRCPRCGISTGEDLGFDIGYHGGEIFGALCFRCGWRF